ncbi:sporulation membrane protein YtaF [Brevibacillus sp. HB1.2]|uniref:Sporulation membrane protein YtaF n=1 Tax=Brevibacillus porteri TaxID=2126350 RepID=A0ABX5FP47_9BACL|nr:MULTISPECIES: sporulation membrane protein YtaF [Brevibacillus]ATF10912.1 sporulation membrane protein YtaF [Brevibacillus brevis X23]MDC0764516.1 sporulation membrane protein YtaF [Brevibacillus sp. AG]MED1797030.1 sporulation membrane protein YtaF [Brevibacillus porteri]MED2129783.1 sporulation membrane protein YtaF [Brevibacillus porteri]MED2744701.1 sporulation membrane protein YtaF [Brevibacillus porteri]
MSGWLALLLVSLAISMDSVSVGLTYGLRNMRMPFLSLVVVSGCSFAVVYGVMLVGSSLTEWLTPEIGKYIGAAVLILMGLFTLWRLIATRSGTEAQESTAASSGAVVAAEKQEEQEPIVLLSQFRIFGVMIQILKDPSKADADRSGHIMGWEAVMLGLALSLDAFGAGISLTFLGYSPLLVALCIAVMSALLLVVGIALGRRAGKASWLTRLTWLPPILLICIGVAKSLK